MGKFVCIECWGPSVAGAQWHKGEGPYCQECHAIKSKPVGAVPIFKHVAPVVVKEAKTKGKK